MSTRSWDAPSTVQAIRKPALIILCWQLPPIEAHDVLVKSGGMSQILLWTSFLEIFGGIALFQTIQGKRYPGDFQFDPLGLSQVYILCVVECCPGCRQQDACHVEGGFVRVGVARKHVRTFLTQSLRLQGKNAGKFEQYQLAEIKHSRLAMLAFSGFTHQYFATKQGVFEQLGNFKSLDGATGPFFSDKVLGQIF